MRARQGQYIKLVNVTLYDVQKLRIQISNRVYALENSGDAMYSNLAVELREELFHFANQMERDIERRIARAVKDLPIMRWLRLVKGIGTRYAGSIIGTIGSPPDTVSQLWSYCGMDVKPICRLAMGEKVAKSGAKTVQYCNLIAYRDKEAAYFLNRQAQRRWEQHCIQQKYEIFKDVRKPTADEQAEYEEYCLEHEEGFIRQAYLDSQQKLCQHDDPIVEMRAPEREHFKGLLLDHNPFLKSTCWKIAGQFVRQGQFYRTIYEQRKDMYTKRDGATLTAGHIENRARRATVKLFLSHLWEMWRKAEGMPAGEIYLKAKLGAEFDRHHTYIHPPHVGLYDE